MKVLIYGSNGWIGGIFTTILQKNNVDFIIGNSRADNKNTLDDEILENQPTHIVSFIGRTHGKIGDKKYTTIDYLEEPGKLIENIRDNLYSPFLLSELSKKYGIHYT